MQNDKQENPNENPFLSAPKHSLSKKKLKSAGMEEDEGEMDVPTEMDTCGVPSPRCPGIQSFSPGSNEIRKLPEPPGSTGISKKKLESHSTKFAQEKAFNNIITGPGAHSGRGDKKEKLETVTLQFLQKRSPSPKPIQTSSLQSQLDFHTSESFKFINPKK